MSIVSIAKTLGNIVFVVNVDLMLSVVTGRLIESNGLCLSSVYKVMMREGKKAVDALSCSTSGLK